MAVTVQAVLGIWTLLAVVPLPLAMMHDRYGDIDIRGDSRSAGDTAPCDVGACAIVPAIEGGTPAGVIQRFQFSVFQRV